MTCLVNTEEVNEAIMAGRRSVYENEFYLSATYPPPIDSPILLSASQRASIAIMHVFIQCPHAVCLVRRAVLNPDDTTALASAVSHMESLIQINLSLHVSELMQTAITVVPIPPSQEIADIMPDTLEFDTVQNMVLCTRYWMLQNILCGFADTLYRHFPAEMALSTLPSPERLRVIDVDSALHLAKSMRWANSVSRDLPLVPLRLHTPIQLSIGPWYRTIRNLSGQRPASPDAQVAFDAELSRAERMKAWAMEQCNQIHIQWEVSAVEEKPILEAIDSMAGEQIPDWLPVRVRFEAEDGEMVMKLDYENKTGSYSERYDFNEPPRPRMPHPGEDDQQWQRENLSVYELPLRGADMQSGITEPAQLIDGRNNEYLNSHTRPADFIHATGRNLCSTSGWWPETPSTSTILIDSTHKASAFSRVLPPSGSKASSVYFGANGCTSPSPGSWPQPFDASSTSPRSSLRNFSSSPTDTTSVTVKFDNRKKNGCFSPAWTN